MAKIDIDRNFCSRSSPSRTISSISGSLPTSVPAGRWEWRRRWPTCSSSGAGSRRGPAGDRSEDREKVSKHNGNVAPPWARSPAPMQRDAIRAIDHRRFASP